MSLMFAETHNMVAYPSKSNASEGFHQIFDFLNGSSIKYALTVNPNIYVSCIKQFWTTVVVKQCMSAKRTSWNEFSSSMASAIICLPSGQQVDEEGDVDENVEVNAGDAAEGDVSDAHGEVPAVAAEPSIPSPTPTTPPPQSTHDIPSTSQVQQTPPHSPQVQPPSPQPQPQPQQATKFTMNLLQKVMDTYAA
nr:hypothetical protein [Tanacetum cinerariifolium]